MARSSFRMNYSRVIKQNEQRLVRRLKPERATRPIPKRRGLATAKADPEKASARQLQADPEKKKASVRDSYKADPEKKKASVRDSYKADPEKKKASARDSYKADPEKKKASYATATTQILNLSNLLKGSDIKRTSRRTALLKAEIRGQFSCH
ncbi:hypothetical protein EMCRGX_G012205 [Ephydatia muelleri]